LGKRKHSIYKGESQTKEEVENQFISNGKENAISSIKYYVLKCRDGDLRLRQFGFTHPEVELIIDKEKGCPVSVGKQTAGSRRSATPVDSAYEREQILMAFDILMTYSHPFFDDPVCMSVYLAERTYYRQVQMFIQWRRGKLEASFKRVF
jgi:hypothetical protein